MSWDELEAIGQAKDIRNVDQQRKDTDRLYLRVFGTEDGIKLMKYMRDTILEQPVAVPGSPTDYAFYREGQNSIIREIEARIYRARNP
jgi:hypothetical protein